MTLQLKTGESVTPTRSLVLVRPLELRDNYQLCSGLVAPGNITDWIPPQQGEVMARGPRVKGLSLGDVVVYGLGCGKKVRLDGVEMLVLDQSEIIGKTVVN